MKQINRRVKLYLEGKARFQNHAERGKKKIEKFNAFFFLIPSSHHDPRQREIIRLRENRALYIYIYTKCRGGIKNDDEDEGEEEAVGLTQLGLI